MSASLAEAREVCPECGDVAAWCPRMVAAEPTLALLREDA